MTTTLLSAALGSADSGAPAAATVHAVLLDPGNAQLSEVWFRLDRGTPEFTWAPDLRHPPAAGARVQAQATYTEDSGAERTAAPAVFEPGASWTVDRLRPSTVWALADTLDWSALRRVVVALGVAGPGGAPEDPVRLELTENAPAAWATIFTSDAENLAFELAYLFADGGELARPPAPMPAGFLTVPAPPPSAELTVDIDAAAARSVDAERLEATFEDLDGVRHVKTWRAADFDDPWTLRVPASGRSAVGRLAYRVDFAHGAPTYRSPGGVVSGPVTLGFFGVARFVADPGVFDRVRSFTVEVTEPAAVTSGVATADAPVAVAVLPGDVPGAPPPGVNPPFAWRTRFELGDGNSTVVSGSGPGPRQLLANPLATTSFTFLPIWADDTEKVRRIRLNYQSLEAGADWKIEGRSQSLDLEPGDGPTVVQFPARDPRRATVSFSGTVITSRGSRPIPQTRVGGRSLAVGAAEPWLSVTVDPAMVDWTRYRSVEVALRRIGEPEVVGGLRFTASDGCQVWGFYGPSTAEREYDLLATYAGPGGEAELRATNQSAGLFALPASPELGR